MAANAEERAREVLAVLLREVKDEQRVRRIIDDALLRLRSSRCRPHFWRMPEVGDDALACAECDQRLPFDELTPQAWAHVLAGYERRHGPGAAADFKCAFYAAQDAKFPRRRIGKAASGSLLKKERLSVAELSGTSRKGG